MVFPRQILENLSRSLDCGQVCQVGVRNDILKDPDWDSISEPFHRIYQVQTSTKASDIKIDNSKGKKATIVSLKSGTYVIVKDKK